MQISAVLQSNRWNEIGRGFNWGVFVESGIRRSQKLIWRIAAHSATPNHNPWTVKFVRTNKQLKTLNMLLSFILTLFLFWIDSLVSFHSVTLRGLCRANWFRLCYNCPHYHCACSKAEQMVHQHCYFTLLRLSALQRQTAKPITFFIHALVSWFHFWKMTFFN